MESCHLRKQAIAGSSLRPLGKPAMAPIIRGTVRISDASSKAAIVRPKPTPDSVVVTNKARAKRSSVELADWPIEARGPAPNLMEEMQKTPRTPPPDHAELYQRQLWAQDLGGIHPTMYNWLLFGRTPAQAIADQVPVPRPLVESVNDDQQGPP